MKTSEKEKENKKKRKKKQDYECITDQERTYSTA